LVDDHTIVREGIATLLKQDKSNRFKIVGGFSSGQEFFNFLKIDTCDVVLMDIQMPEKNGDSIIELVGQKYPEVSVIVLSMITKDYMIEKVLKSGALGYLPKEASIAEIKKAIESARLKHIHFNHLLTEDKYQIFKKGKKEKNSLSLREQIIISLIANGLNNNQIGDKLNISPSTVKKHKENIFKKTKCESTTQLIHFALENGLSNQYSKSS
jgi:DNA-binding NarL/FixJ family response regulator